jgi:hypothetical protein
MQPKQRRRALLFTAARIVLVWAVVFTAYFFAPIDRDWSSDVVVQLSIVVVVLVLFVLWQSGRIVRATHPELRAIEALGAIVAVFLVLFASTYLAMSHYSSSTFSQPLDHMSALYFTITVFSTVGFGDITPRTDPALALVSAQMLLDLLVIAAVVRLLIMAVRTGLNRPQDAS